MADDDPKLSTGRLARLAKLASMSARLSTDVVARGVKRLTGDESASALGAGAAEKLVATLGDLKGLAMKLGQQLSMDSEMLSPEVRAIVSRLQNAAPPMPWARVREVLCAELGRPPEEAFASFSEAPLAAASLGQVHLATLHDGTRVAVKVQYPDIADALHADLSNLGTMVKVVSTTTRITHGRDYFEELKAGLLEELDYVEEARRGELYREACAQLPGLVIPRSYPALTTRRVLTLELLEGETFKDFLARREGVDNAERFRVAGLLTQALWGPFLLHGVVHADPHPGNFMLLPDGRLGVLDFGTVKRLSPVWCSVNRRLFHGIVHGEPFDVVALSLESGFVFDDAAAARPFAEEVLDIIARPLRSDFFDFAEAGMSRELRNVMLKNAHRLPGIKPPKQCVQFFRAVGGMAQNLENLGASGNYRATHDALLALAASPG